MKLCEDQMNKPLSEPQTELGKRWMEYALELDDAQAEIARLKEKLMQLVARIQSADDLHAVFTIKDSKEFLDAARKEGE